MLLLGIQVTWTGKGILPISVRNIVQDHWGPPGRTSPPFHTFRVLCCRTPKAPAPEVTCSEKTLEAVGKVRGYPQVTSKLVERSEHLAAEAVEDCDHSWDTPGTPGERVWRGEMSIWWSCLYTRGEEDGLGTITVRMASFVPGKLGAMWCSCLRETTVWSFIT